MLQSFLPPHNVYYSTSKMHQYLSAKKRPTCLEQRGNQVADALFSATEIIDKGFWSNYGFCQKNHYPLLSKCWKKTKEANLSYFRHPVFIIFNEGKIFWEFSKLVISTFAFNHSTKDAKSSAGNRCFDLPCGPENWKRHARGMKLPGNLLVRRAALHLLSQFAYKCSWMMLASIFFQLSLAPIFQPFHMHSRSNWLNN